MFSVRHSLSFIGLMAVILLNGGCASTLADNMSNTLSNAILNEDDPQLVQDGLPAYLLLIDGLIIDNPESEGLLVAGAKLNGAYGSIFADDKTRSLHMAKKAFGYAHRAMCERVEEICAAEKTPYRQFKTQLEEISESDVPVAYAYASAWAGVIQANSKDWKAIADIPKVEALLERIIDLVPDYENGRPHLYLGVMRSQIPPSLGGHPEEGKKEFEAAIRLSDGKDMMAKVMYAEYYARLVFNKELHNQLLNEVINGDPVVPGLTLTNTLAQKRARELLKSGKRYF